MAAINTSRFPVVSAWAKRITLTGTSVTTILSVTARKTALYSLSAYVNVINASTVVTVSYTWTDPTDGQQHTVNWLNAVNEPTGSYPLGSVLIAAKGGTTITITAQAGTANNVTVSAVVEEKA